MKKVLVLSHSPHVGGGELALKSLIESCSTDYEWTIAIPGNIAPSSAILPKNIQVVLLPELHWWCHEAHDTPQLTRRSHFEKSLQKLHALANNSDLLLTNTITIPWLGFIAQKVNKPHIWYIHEFGDIDHNLQFVAGYTESLRMIDACSSRVLTISEAVRSHIAKVIPKEKIDIIHQSIEFENLINIPPADLTQPLTRLLCLGAIKPSKGQHIALKSFDGITDKTLSIIGPAANQAYVENLSTAAKSGGARITVQNRRYNPTVELATHDAVLMCSDNEGLGRVTLESLAAGRLVVGYDCPSTRSLLADGRGILYSPNTPEALHKVLTNLPELVKNVNISDARKYIQHTYSSKTQAFDFNTSVSKANSGPEANKVFAIDSYLSVLDGRGLWLNHSRRMKHLLKAKIPKFIKKIPKRITGR